MFSVFDCDSNGKPLSCESILSFHSKGQLRESPLDSPLLREVFIGQLAAVPIDENNRMLAVYTNTVRNVIISNNLPVYPGYSCKLPYVYDNDYKNYVDNMDTKSLTRFVTQYAKKYMYSNPPQTMIVTPVAMGHILTTLSKKLSVLQRDDCWKIVRGIEFEGIRIANILYDLYDRDICNRNMIINPSLKCIVNDSKNKSSFMGIHIEDDTHYCSIILVAMIYSIKGYNQLITNDLDKLCLLLRNLLACYDNVKPLVLFKRTIRDLVDDERGLLVLAFTKECPEMISCISSMTVLKRVIQIENSYR